MGSASGSSREDAALLLRSRSPELCTICDNDMYGLSEEVTRKFRMGLHVARNSTGFFNGIWSDMLIATTYMKFGSSPGGLVGVTLKPKSVIRWAYSFHKISTMTKELKEITDTSNREGRH